MLLLLFLTLIKSTSSVDDLDCPTAHYQSQQGQTEWVASIFHPPSSSSISPSISPLTFVFLIFLHMLCTGCSFYLNLVDNTVNIRHTEVGPFGVKNVLYKL